MSIEKLVNTIFNEWLSPYKFSLVIRNEVQDVAQIDTECSYTLETSTQSCWQTGQRNYNCKSLSECESDINYYRKEISRGKHERVNNLAINRINRAPIASFNGIKVIDKIERSYVKSCDNCGGNGDNRCDYCSGTGRVHCSSCTYGRSICNGCGGTGRFFSVSDQKTYSCQTCAGSGRISCWSCYGSSYVNCNSCGGNGKTPCSPCNQSGWFTYTVTATCSVVSKQHINWTADNSPNWVVGYIEKAIDGKTPLAPFNDTVSWNVPSFELDTTNIPFRGTLRGDLYSSSAGVTVDQFAEKHCQFVGIIPTAYNLNEIMDEPITSLLSEVNQKKDLDDIKSLFSTRVAKHNFSEYRNTSRPNNFIEYANLLSNASCNALKSCFISLGGHFKSLRNYVKISHLIRFTVMFLLLGVGLIGLTKTFVSGIYWQQVSLLEIIKATPAVFQLSSSILFKQPLLFFTVLYGLFIPSMLLMKLLSSMQRGSTILMIKWFVISSSILIILLYQGVSRAPQVSLLQWNNDHFFTVMESLIKPNIVMELLLVSFLAALLRSRREAYKLNKKLVSSMKSTELKQLLEYD